MKTKIIILIAVFTVKMGFSQVIITDKSTYSLDNSAILKLDSDRKGLLFSRVSLNAKDDIMTVPSPQNGNLVFNTNPNAVDLQESIAYFDQGRWNSIYTTLQALTKIDIVNINLENSATPVLITNYNNVNFSIGEVLTSAWSYLNIQENVALSRSKNSLAFSLEGMVQIDKNQSLYFDYAVAVFVDDKLAVVRKYHKNKENNTICQWDKFILNGIISNIPVGNHTVKVYARNLGSSAASANTSLMYGGVGRNVDVASTPCSNMSDFMSKIILNTTVVESI